MYNHREEIVWLLNIMNINDNRPEIKEKDILDTLYLSIELLE